MRRVPELDGLRGLAALSIVTYHLKPNWLPFGWAAVDLFFVLSGFLITAVLLKNVGGDRYFRAFYGRRALRIWPVYYLALLVGVVVNSVLPRPYPLDNLPYLLTFTQNVQMYFHQDVPPFLPIFDHFWTLALEEQYYLIWPALVLLARRGALVAVALGFWASCYAMRHYGFDGRLLLARGDGFALGSILAVILAARGPGVRRLALFVGSALAGFTVAAADFSGMRPVSSTNLIVAFNVCGFGVVGLVASLAGRPGLGWLRARPLVGLGTISYGLYVYHVPVIWAVELVFRKFGVSHPIGPGHPWWRALIELTISLGVAVASWVWLERPILALKGRLRYGAAADGKTIPGAGRGGDFS